MSDFETHEAGTQDRLDLLHEVYYAAKSLRELSLLSGVPIKKDSRRKAESLLDLAIANYDEFDGDY